MKRCPQCHRVETDEALVFCRTDGTALVNDSLMNSEAGTAQLSSASAASEFGTSVLPHNTNAELSRNTGPTTVLVQPTPTITHELPRRKPRTTWILAAVAVAVITCAVVGYFVFIKRERAIESIAVLPFVNRSANADSEYL
ncbi:MAG: hypothetical protein DMF69_04660, partial [Acidobacteria bacterium]